MRLSERLAAGPGLYVGNGEGPESGPFVARIEIGLLPNGGVSIDYEAMSREQGVQHREHSLLVGEPDGRDRLLIAHEESPYMTDLHETSPGSGRFEQGEIAGPYTQAVVIEVPEDGRLTYAWWWAPAGNEPIEQSKADVRIV